MFRISKAIQAAYTSKGPVLNSVTQSVATNNVAKLNYKDNFFNQQQIEHLDNVADYFAQRMEPDSYEFKTDSTANKPPKPK